MFQKGSFLSAVLVFIVAATLQHVAETKIIGKCQLVRTLYNNGVPYNELADYACIVAGESTYNTRAVNANNADGSSDWGLFQINDRFWCSPNNGRASANLCRMSCQQLLSDDPRNSIACAKYLRQQQGFSAWVAWNNRCRDNKPSVGHCFQRNYPNFG